MTLPLKLEPIIGFLESNRSFRVGDAPDILKDSAKVTLCRNLVRNGLLRIKGRAESGRTGSDAPPVPDIPDWLAPSGI